MCDHSSPLRPAPVGGIARNGQWRNSYARTLLVPLLAWLLMAPGSVHAQEGKKVLTKPDSAGVSTDPTPANRTSPTKNLDGDNPAEAADQQRKKDTTAAVDSTKTDTTSPEVTELQQKLAKLAERIDALEKTSDPVGVLSVKHTIPVHLSYRMKAREYSIQKNGSSGYQLTLLLGKKRDKAEYVTTLSAKPEEWSKGYLEDLSFTCSRTGKHEELGTADYNIKLPSFLFYKLHRWSKKESVDADKIEHSRTLNWINLRRKKTYFEDPRELNFKIKDGYITVKNGAVWQTSLHGNLYNEKNEVVDEDYHFFSNLPVSVYSSTRIVKDHPRIVVYNTNKRVKQPYNYYLRFSDLLSYKPLPTIHTNIIAPADSCYKLAESDIAKGADGKPKPFIYTDTTYRSTLARIFEIKAYSDALQLLDDEPNGVANTEFNARITLNTSHINSSFVASSEFNVYAGINAFAENDGSVFVIPSGDENDPYANVLDLMQRRRFYFGINYQLLRWDCKWYGFDALNLFAESYLSSVKDSTEANVNLAELESRTVMTLNPGIESVFRVEGGKFLVVYVGQRQMLPVLQDGKLRLDHGLRADERGVNDNFEDQAGFFERVYGEYFLEAKFSPFGNRNQRDRIYFRGSYVRSYTNGNSFTRFQVGYSRSFGDFVKLVSKKKGASKDSDK